MSESKEQPPRRKPARDRNAVRIAELLAELGPLLRLVEPDLESADLILRFRANRRGELAQSVPVVGPDD